MLLGENLLLDNLRNRYSHFFGVARLDAKVDAGLCCQKADCCRPVTLHNSFAENVWVQGIVLLPFP